jgi:hypothetical protein
VFGQSPSQALPLVELAQTATNYGIEIVADDLGFPVRTTWGIIDGSTADDGELLRYTKFFVPEFELYPVDIIRRTRIKRVSLCCDLSFAGQRRAAVPDYEHNTLYLDVGWGTYDTSYRRKVIHHEFFHFIDYCDDGSVYQDDSWNRLNPAHFQYGLGGHAAQAMAMTSDLTTRYRGFLNHYSTTGVEEDKAEVFANLIVETGYSEARAKDDAVLQAKIERMKELLASFCPEMDGRFWERVGMIDRPDK